MNVPFVTHVKGDAFWMFILNSIHSILSVTTFFFVKNTTFIDEY